LIEITNLTYHYPLPKAAKPALAGVTLTWPQNKISCLLGATGSGKSTLAKLACGLLKPTDGSVNIDGQELAALKRFNVLSTKVGLVKQNPDSQLIGTTVMEDVAFGLKNLGLKPAEVKEQVDWVLNALNLTKLAQKEPHHLSAGQRQKVAVAGVIALKPRYIFFDEATSRLDNQGKQEIFQLYQQLLQLGITPIIITHNLEEALLASKVVVLDNGKLFAVGGQELLKNELILSKAGLCPNDTFLVSQALMTKGWPLTPSPVLQDLVAAVEKLWCYA
jgi:energy-coupling factor transport system ATP-binding protein